MKSKFKKLNLILKIFSVIFLSILSGLFTYGAVKVFTNSQRVAVQIITGNLVDEEANKTQKPPSSDKYDNVIFEGDIVFIKSQIIYDEIFGEDSDLSDSDKDDWDKPLPNGPPLPDEEFEKPPLPETNDPSGGPGDVEDNPNHNSEGVGSSEDVNDKEEGSGSSSSSKPNLPPPDISSRPEIPPPPPDKNDPAESLPGSGEDNSSSKPNIPNPPTDKDDPIESLPGSGEDSSSSKPGIPNPPTNSNDPVESLPGGEIPTKPTDPEVPSKPTDPEVPSKPNIPNPPTDPDDPVESLPGSGDNSSSKPNIPPPETDPDDPVESLPGTGEDSSNPSKPNKPGKPDTSKPFGGVSVLRGFTPKTLMEAFQVISEIVGNKSLKSKFEITPQVFTFFGVWCGEYNFGNYKDQKLNYYTAHQHKDIYGGFKGPFQMASSYFNQYSTTKNLVLSYQYYITRTENSSIPDENRFGNNSTINKNNLRFSQNLRWNSTADNRSYFFPDLAMWCYNSWSTALTNVSDRINAMYKYYNLDLEAQEFMTSCLATQVHASFYIDSYWSKSPVAEDGRLKNPEKNWLLAYQLELAQTGLYKEILSWTTGFTSESRKEILNACFGASKSFAARLNSIKARPFKINYVGKTAASTGIASPSGNWDAPVVGISRYYWGKMAMKETEYYITKWFDDNNLEIPPGMFGGFEETPGKAQGIYVVDGTSMTLEQFLKKKGITQDSYYNSAKSYFGTTGYHTCGIEAKISEKMAGQWISGQKYSTPLYPQDKPDCKCDSYRRLSAGNDVNPIGTYGCHIYAAAYAVSSLTGRLINPAEMLVFLRATGGINTSGYTVYGSYASSMKYFGISAFSQRGMSKNWWEIIDKTLHQNGLIVTFVYGKDSTDINKSNGTHFIVITGKESNGKYTIYTSSSLSEANFTWSRDTVEKGWRQFKGIKGAIIPMVYGEKEWNGKDWIPEGANTEIK